MTGRRHFIKHFLPIILLFFLFIISNGYAIKPKERAFEFSYIVKIEEIPKDSKSINIWLPYPKNHPYQLIKDVSVKADFPTTLRFDKKFKNSILHLSTPNTGIKEINISITYNVLRKERGNYFTVLKKEEMSKYLESNRLMNISEKIKKLAIKITAEKNSKLEKARAIYDYVLSHMSYNKTTPGWGQGDTERACIIGKGNCTDFHSLFISLARAINIPARLIMGFPLPKDSKGELGGYHCWAEFYIHSKGWIPVDISEAWKDKSKRDYFFGHCCENRIEFSEGRDIILEPEQKSGPLNYFIYPYIEIDNSSYDRIKKEFRFKNLL